jgi:DNA (cytosine-5)-methyltransferase 1
MKYSSVCSGIEAATVAWHPLGWEPQWFSEIEAFPSSVLKHHYPETPNYGDMTNFKEWSNEPIDLFVGGTPCQSFSVAGLRKGMDDPRGNLALTYLAIADKYRPRWLVWENVPGVLSSNGGRDFGAFLGALGQLGYGFAYRVLDAQYFGVAQRRRRVFVVGYLGDWRRAAAVLFERESLSGHPAPIREARQGSAGRPARGTGSGKPTFGTLMANAGTKLWLGNQEALSGDYHVLEPVAFGWQNSASQGDSVSEHFTPTLDKSKTPAVLTTSSDTLYGQGIRHGDLYARTQKNDSRSPLPALRAEVGEETFTQWGLGILDSLQPAPVLQSLLHGSRVRYTPLSRCWPVHCALSRAEDRAARAVQSVQDAQRQRCAPSGRQLSKQLARELGSYLSELSQPGAQTARLVHDLWQASEGFGVLREALSAFQEVGRPNAHETQSAHAAVAVRRLTVSECEFLQGFPRNYTLAPHRGKPAADGPRYKALGNSMAVPVMRWIGERIEMVDNL